MVVMLVLTVIIGFLTLDYIVQRRGPRRVPAPLPSPAEMKKKLLQRPDPMALKANELPGGLFISPWHVWAQVEPSGSVRLGVDRLLLSFLGGVEYLYPLPEGSEVSRGGPLMMLRFGRRALKIRSPIDGVITAVNDEARRGPSGIEHDPYGNGWVYRISPSRLPEALDHMVLAEDARSWLERELSRLCGLLSSIPGAKQFAGLTLADGGPPVDGWPDLLGDQDWEELVAGFFAEAATGDAYAGATNPAPEPAHLPGA